MFLNQIYAVKKMLENFEGLVPFSLSQTMKDDFLKSDYETLTPKGDIYMVSLLSLSELNHISLGYLM